MGSVYLMAAEWKGNKSFYNLAEKAAKADCAKHAKLLKGLVGTAGFEPTTSTV